MSGIDLSANPSHHPLLPEGTQERVSLVLLNPEPDESLGVCRGIAVSLLIGLAGWSGFYLLVRLLLA